MPIDLAPIPNPPAQRLLLAACAGVALFGLAMVLAPGLTQRGFSALIYGDPAAIAALGAAAEGYIRLAHAVMGALMLGWGVLMAAVASGAAAGPGRWRWLGLSLLAWWLPDTAASLAMGFWQNAALNAVFALLLAGPLVALARGPRSG